MKPFVDTYALIAWLNPRDQAHGPVSEYLNNHTGPLVTTEWVLMEVADALGGSPTRSKVIEFLRAIRSDAQFDIVGYEQSTYDSGFGLFCSRQDKDWSLTDCISFAVMAKQGLRDALTGDHHFFQAGYRAIFGKD